MALVAERVWALEKEPRGSSAQLTAADPRKGDGGCRRLGHAAWGELQDLEERGSDSFLF